MQVLPDLNKISVDTYLDHCSFFAKEYGANAVSIVNSDRDDNKLFMICAIALQGSQSQEFREKEKIESPILTSIIQRGLPSRLMDFERHPELINWGEALGIDQEFSLMQIPISGSDSQDYSKWALLLIKSDGNWQYKDQKSLEHVMRDYDFSSIAEEFHSLEASAEYDEDLIPGNSEDKKPGNVDIDSLAANNFGNLQTKNRQHKKDIERLLSYIDSLGDKVPDRQNGQPQATSHNDLVDDLQTENINLKEALISIEHKRAGSDLQEPRLLTRANEELRLALTELASLNEELEYERNFSGSESEGPSNEGKLESEKAEKIAGIAQNMRQPLSSILGYTDLLLSESVGILGALQRNFLERVHNSSERMDGMVADLIHAAEMDTSGLDLSRKAVNIITIIDNVINLLGPKLQEKEITIRVNLPPELPLIETDEDALQQIIYHLLNNSYLASPAKGQITLRAIEENGNESENYVFIQFSDSGLGISDEDISRVFSRVYRTQNPVIQGVGDTGVGLTIAETLSKSLGGRIWVESDAGKGATFSLLLPVKMEQVS